MGSFSRGASRKRSVVFVCNELWAFRRHREYLALTLKKLALQVVLYADNTEGLSDDLQYEFRRLRIERFRFDLLRDLLMFFTLVRVLHRDKPNILHLINLKPYLYGGLAAFFARLLGWRGNLVITVAGLGRLYDPDYQATWWKRMRCLVVETALRVSTRHAKVTFETEHDRDFWLKRNLIAPAQATVVNGTGVDLNAYSPGYRQAENGMLRILYAGRLLRSKGLDIFLDAASIINSSSIQPGVEMLVAGFEENDPDSVSVSLLSNNPDVNFLGTVSEMPELLRGIDIVALPSRYNEGIPRILIEAAATGCIPISTKFPGSDALIDDNVTGIFVTNNRGLTLAEELARLILGLRDDPELRQYLSENATERVRSHGFSETEILSTFLHLYGLTERFRQDRTNAPDDLSGGPFLERHELQIAR
ncbi:MAG: glycosyltransferase [Alphaproteobacteria bacterium]|nr:glycosyltransferase [Alphaproteobacteria bacterium]